MIVTHNPVSPETAKRPVYCPDCRWAGTLIECRLRINSVAVCPKCGSYAEWDRVVGVAVEDSVPGTDGKTETVRVRLGESEEARP